MDELRLRKHNKLQRIKEGIKMRTYHVITVYLNKNAVLQRCCQM